MLSMTLAKPTSEANYMPAGACCARNTTMAAIQAAIPIGRACSGSWTTYRQKRLMSSLSIRLNRDTPRRVRPMRSETRATLVAGLSCRETGFCRQRQTVCKRSPKSDLTFAETDRSHTTAPIRGVSTKGRKISVREGLCGGGSGIRTTNLARRTRLKSRAHSAC